MCIATIAERLFGNKNKEKKRKKKWRVVDGTERGFVTLQT